MESQIGKYYYVRCGDNPNYFKTVQIVRNIFTGNLQSRMSNPLYGSVPDGIPEMPKQMRMRLQSCNNALPYSS